MNKLSNAGIKRALAGGSALVFLSVLVASIFLTLLSLKPTPVKAQGASFDWINAMTIKVGDLVFTDPDVLDDELWFESSAAARCTFADQNINDIATDRILVSNDKSSGTRFVVDQDNKNASGALTCTATQTKLTGMNPVNANILWYRAGDSIKPVSNAVSFDKTSTIAKLGNSSNVEIFTRVGESGEPCPDVIAHGTNGDYTGYYVFPMAPEGTDYAQSGIVSEHYEGIFPDKPRNCEVAAEEIREVFKVGHITDECIGGNSGDEGCGSTAIRYREFPLVWFDDAYRIPQVGNETNASDPTAVNTNKPEEVKKSACDQSFSFVDWVSLKWIICPFINILMGGVDLLEDLLVSQMKIDTIPLGSDTPYHKVWGSLRSIALAIIVIVALVMVIFEAAGIEAFSAYTMRTLFTRFGIAVLFIILSWTVLAELMNVINGLIDGARTLIYAPFNEQFGANNLETGSAVILLMLGTGGLLALGPWGLLSFVLTAMLSIAITLLVLILVHTIIYLLIIFSPIAIALSVLPNTRKGYEFWRSSLFSLLLGLIAVAFAMPAIDVIAEAVFHLGGTINQITGLLLKLLRAFIILWIFARVGGLAATLTGAINDRSRGGFDRLRNFRKGQTSGRHERRMKGEGNTFGSARLTNAYRRAGNIGRGGLGLTRRGRARYAASTQGTASETADEILKRDNDRYAGDDDAMALALQGGMTERDFVNQYMARTGADQASARATLAGLESSFGVTLGSNAMRMAAFKARATSKTGYASGDYNAMANDAASLMNAGLLTQSDAADIFRHNKDRADISGVDHKVWFEMLGKARAQHSNGKRGNELLTDSDMKNMRRDALKNASPGQLIGGYHLGVSALAPEMVDQMKETAVRASDVNLSQSERDAAWGDLQRQVGAYKARHQLSPQVSEKIQGIYGGVGAETVMGPGNKEMSIRELSEMLSSGQKSAEAGVDNSAFLDAFHVYAAGSVDEYNNMVARGTGGPGSGPVGMPRL